MEDGETDVMTAGCTVHPRSGEVEMTVTVGTKASAATSCNGQNTTSHEIEDDQINDGNM